MATKPRAAIAVCVVVDMNALERVKADLADLDKQNPDRRGPSGIWANDLAKLIAVAEKAQKLRPLFNLMADEEIELDDALSELDKP